MNPKPYSKLVGDLEIRIRPDGTLVFVAPDQDLMELAEALRNDEQETTESLEKDKHGRTDGQAQKPASGR
jgi:hypothetical protein